MPKAQFSGGVNHCCAVRYGVKGLGDLATTLYSLQDVYSENLTDLVMDETPGEVPTRLANFKQQRIALEFSINDINDYFIIDQIVLFLKPVATGYPG